MRPNATSRRYRRDSQENRTDEAVPRRSAPLRRSARSPSSRLAARSALAAASPRRRSSRAQNYMRLKNPQPVESGKKIEVLSSSPTAARTAATSIPSSSRGSKQLPADVEFRRVPVDFGREQWANLGKVYYTLEALGAEKTLTSDVFVAVHDKKLPLRPGQGVLRLGRRARAGPQEGRGHVQLVRRQQQDEPRDASSRRTTTCSRCRSCIVDGKFQMSRGQGRHARGDARGDEPADREGARRAAEVVTRTRARTRLAADVPAARREAAGP